MRSIRGSLHLLPLGLLWLATPACTSSAGSGADGGEGDQATPLAGLTRTDTIVSAQLSAPVDLVRDEWGIPHIYGKNLADVIFAEGYVHAMDRLVPMDLLRHNADGSLAELVGGLSASAVDGDIQMRLHHLRRTAEQAYATLTASTDPKDKLLVKMLTAYAAGVNAWIDVLKNGNAPLPAPLILLYDPHTTRPWTEVDSLVMLEFETFFFNYNAGQEIQYTRLQAKAQAQFDASLDPVRKARSGLGKDFWILAPIDPTYTISGWTGMNGDSSLARHQGALPDGQGNLMALLEADQASAEAVGRNRRLRPEMASNNWAISPRLTASGNVLVANDTHVPLQNPTIWYLVHLVGRGGDLEFNVMGPSVTGVPSIVLGMNQHVAWGATTDQIDQTDVYAETVVPCDGSNDPCVLFKGGKVKLSPRVESFGIGRFGKIVDTRKVTFYDVPHHGPILPRLTADHGIEPLGGSELSVRYVGYEPNLLSRLLLQVLTARSVAEFDAGLRAENKTAAFNWTMGDDQGHFGWTEVLRVPRRAPGFAPWGVLPGDGRAEWGGDMDPKYIPHAWDPDKGYIATANNDPIGVTDDNDPFFSEPMVDGAPLYLSWEYTEGARIGRITKRIEEYKTKGHKLTADDMSSIQADTVSEYGQMLAPTMVSAAADLGKEITTAGSVPELSSLVAAAPAKARAALAALSAVLPAWSYDMPAGMAEDSPTADQIRDSQATLVFHVWFAWFIQYAFDDEVKALGEDPGAGALGKLAVFSATRPAVLKTGLSKDTGDSILFDDMTTPQLVESKRFIAAKALLAALAALADRLGPDATAWRWGQVHTLSLDFLAPMATLRIPLASDPRYGNGFPRHGGIESVDAAGGGRSTTDFTYHNGPGIRFVCELDPVKGPIARNVLPGGEVFDPASPHYRDQMELWRRNQTFPLAYQDADVVTSARKEIARHPELGRMRFSATP